MATFYITPFTKGGPDRLQIPAGHGTAQTITTSGSSARNSTNFASDVEFLRIYCDVAVFYALGDSAVTASSSDHYVPAGTLLDIGLDNKTRIAVIEA